MDFWWGYLLLGLAAGTMGATLGIGGGVLMVPMLVWFFPPGQKQAQAWSLAVMIPMALAATLRHMANPKIEYDWSAVGLMALAAIGGAYLGTYFAKQLPVMILKRIFAVIMVVAAVKMAFFSAPKDKQDAEGSPPAAAPLESPPSSAGEVEGS